ncbi:MAG TPA: permease-like cell division protein FtsX [Chloroflexota bacterium]|nr:permease-like cell division protein FtsX [Chloroflexota bacterium]
MPLSQTTRTAFKSITRHRGASLVAVVTLAFMLSALTTFVLVASGLGTAASGLASKANLIADLNPAVGAQRAARLEREITAYWPQTRVRYVSKANALVQFRKTFAGNSTMLSALEGNPLPASVEVRSSDPLILNKVAGMLAGDSRVQRVIFNPNLTHKLAEITNIVTFGGLAVISGLAFLALVIVVNTTHLTVEARREEIEVMKLIGATHGFVRNPLIVEGVLLGLGGAALAAIAAIGVFLPILKAILGGTSSFGAILPINSGLLFLAQLGALVVFTGAGIGALGSYFSMRKFARI